MKIQSINADKLASLSDFLTHSIQLMDDCGLSPLAVLDDNKPVFYVLTPESWARVSGQLREHKIGYLSHAQSVVIDASTLASAPAPAKVIKTKLKALEMQDEPAQDRRSFEKQNNFNVLAEQLLEAEWERVMRSELSASSVGIQKNRLDAHVLPFFRYIPPTQVTHVVLDDFVSRLTKHQLSTTTISQYLVIVRKLLKLAVRKGLLKEVPDLPKVRVAVQPRSMLTLAEYGKVCRMALKMSRTGLIAPEVKSTDGQRDRFWVAPRNMRLAPDMFWVIRFMVNSFVRPGDLRELKHKHVSVVRGESVYLRLKMPKTKKHDKPMVTLSPAVQVYESARRHSQSQGFGGDEDYVFLPAEKDRNYALAVLGFWFKWVMREAGLSTTDELDRTRTLYCLRHTSLMFRLLYGQGIDMLTLARNARTSVQMIEKFYASSLDGEMNVKMLQSRRTVKTR
jgi:integrase/PHD/YefM family antitoxin component YafN of YafNO toxin-antitoxin module